MFLYYMIEDLILKFYYNITDYFIYKIYKFKIVFDENDYCLCEKVGFDKQYFFDLRNELHSIVYEIDKKSNIVTRLGKISYDECNVMFKKILLEGVLNDKNIFS